MLGRPKSGHVLLRLESSRRSADTSVGFHITATLSGAVCRDRYSASLAGFITASPDLDKCFTCCE